MLVLLLGAAPASAQQRRSRRPPYYPAPPPEQAPTVAAGRADHRPQLAAAGGAAKIERTEIASDAEAQLFADARKIVWGRYAKMKGAKPGDVAVTKQGNVWVVKGRIDSVAPGTEGDWASIDGVVETHLGRPSCRSAARSRSASPRSRRARRARWRACCNFKRSGKSQVWRLAEGDNPCDGTRENFDLVYEKPVEKKPVPAQPKRS